MTEKLPSREQALDFLQRVHCSAKVIGHCIAVAEVAVETAETCRRKGLKVDIRLVEIGALLHDVGRAKTHTVNHVVVGAQITKSAGLPEPLIMIIKRHVGGGITTEEAEELGWPRDVYTPVTLEEKIVCYADKLIEDAKRAPIEMAVEKLCQERKTEAARRVKRLYDEINGLVGDSS